MKRHLRLLNWEFQARLGWGEEERKIPQTIQVSLRFTPQSPWNAHQTDDLKDTWDYGEIYQDWKKILETQEFKLIEALTQALWQSAATWLKKSPGTLHLNVVKIRLPLELSQGSSAVEWEGPVN